MPSNTNLRLKKPYPQYDQVWRPDDRVEHALRKVDLARWEHDRFEENLHLGTWQQAEDAKTKSILLYRLRKSLRQFGLSKEQIAAVMDHVEMKCGSRSGLRQAVPSSINFSCWVDRATFGKVRYLLCEANMSNHDQREGSSLLRTERWLPDLLDDVLWEYTKMSFSLSISSDLDEQQRLAFANQLDTIDEVRKFELSSLELKREMKSARLEVMERKELEREGQTSAKLEAKEKEELKAREMELKVERTKELKEKKPVERAKRKAEAQEMFLTPNGSIKSPIQNVSRMRIENSEERTQPTYLRKRVGRRKGQVGAPVLALNRPTYIRVHRRYLEVDTLDFYDLPWE